MIIILCHCIGRLRLPGPDTVVLANHFHPNPPKNLLTVSYLLNSFEKSQDYFFLCNGSAGGHNKDHDGVKNMSFYLVHHLGYRKI